MMRIIFPAMYQGESDGSDIRSITSHSMFQAFLDYIRSGSTAKLNLGPNQMTTGQLSDLVNAISHGAVQEVTFSNTFRGRKFLPILVELMSLNIEQVKIYDCAISSRMAWQILKAHAKGGVKRLDLEIEATGVRCSNPRKELQMEILNRINECKRTGQPTPSDTEIDNFTQ